MKKAQTNLFLSALFSYGLQKTNTLVYSAKFSKTLISCFQQRIQIQLRFFLQCFPKKLFQMRKNFRKTQAVLWDNTLYYLHLFHILSGEAKRLGCFFVFLRIFPKNAGAPFWRYDRIKSVFQHPNFVSYSQRQCAAASSLAN